MTSERTNFNCCPRGKLEDALCTRCVECSQYLPSRLVENFNGDQTVYFMDRNIGMSPGRIVGFLQKNSEPLLQIRYEAPEWSDERYDLELGIDKVFENVDAFIAAMGSRRREKTYQSTEGTEEEDGTDDKNTPEKIPTDFANNTRKSSKRLQNVSADVFELKLLDLVDRSGGLSNSEAARHAAKLFQAGAQSKERKSLAIAVISLSLPRSKDDRLKTLILNSFLIDGHGAELLASWLTKDVDTGFALGPQIAGILTQSLRLNESSSSSSELIKQVSTIQTMTASALEQERADLRKSSVDGASAAAAGSSPLPVKGTSEDTHVRWGFASSSSIFSSSSPILTFQGNNGEHDTRNLFRRGCIALAKAAENFILASGSSKFRTINSTQISQPGTDTGRSKKLEIYIGNKRYLSQSGVHSAPNIRPTKQQKGTALSKLLSGENPRQEISRKEKDKFTAREAMHIPATLIALGKQKDKMTQNVQAQCPQSFSRDSLESSVVLPDVVPFHLAGVDGSYFRSSSTKTVRWADTSGHGQLENILEYDLVLTELVAMGTFRHIRHQHLIEPGHSLDAMTLDELYSPRPDVLDTENMSYSDRLKLERQRERETFQRQHQENVERAGHLKTALPWVTPNLAEVANAEFNVDDIPAFQSNEKHRMKVMLSNKLDIFYQREIDIPIEPSTPSNSLLDSTHEQNSCSHIPWYDVSGGTTTDDIIAAEENNDLIDGLPEYVKLLNEYQLMQLLEMLSDEANAYLLNDVNNPAFFELIRTVAPDVAYTASS